MKHSTALTTANTFGGRARLDSSHTLVGIAPPAAPSDPGMPHRAPLATVRDINEVFPGTVTQQRPRAALRRKEGPRRERLGESSVRFGSRGPALTLLDPVELAARTLPAPPEESGVYRRVESEEEEVYIEVDLEEPAAAEEVAVATKPARPILPTLDMEDIGPTVAPISVEAQPTSSRALAWIALAVAAAAGIATHFAVVG